VPLLTPRLSSYWVNLVTPIQRHVARALIESLRHETICRDSRARDTFSVAPTSFEAAVTNALGRHAAHEVQTQWTDATAIIPGPQVDTSHLLTDVRTVESEIPPQTLFIQVQSLGGDNGWAYADWLWRLRGWLDKQLGGVGLRRGRRHPTHLAVGDVLDFWRVAEFQPERHLKLRAEMRVWGDAWLEFTVEPTTNGSRLTQTASYYPKGLWGHIYWWTLTPVHALVFRGLARAIVRRARRQTTSA
ncbi:MAG TPA: SDR family oxidoreductase, partial [candidate division Zixibacteria bacterium]|nr:SDR family oxidoreductase [candidate division Zixibacteria bacterium]